MRIGEYKDIIAGVVLVALVLGGLILLVLFRDTGSRETAPLSNVMLANDWTKGSQDAAIALVEYSDFQCPACASYYPVVKRLADEFKDSVRFSYRHFPLSAIHANADRAARAAEAAGRQGRFWEMHDMLFENQEDWSRAGDARGLFREYARSLNLNADEFEEAMDSDAVREKVRSDYQSGLASRVRGTPTFFLNGVEIQNPRNYGEFRTVILQALEAEL